MNNKMYLCPMKKDLHTSTALYDHHYLPSIIIIVLLLSVPAFSFIIANSTDVSAQVSGSIISSNKKGAYIDQVNFLHYLDENWLFKT